MGIIETGNVWVGHDLNESIKLGILSGLIACDYLAPQNIDLAALAVMKHAWHERDSIKYTLKLLRS